MERRNFLIAFSTGAIGAPLLSFAQQPAKLIRIGFLGAVSAPLLTRDRGYYKKYFRGLAVVGPTA